MFGVSKPLPEDFDPEKAVFLSLTGTAHQAVYDARIKVGDRVIIFRLATIGLLIILLARLNGTTWIGAVDPIEKRRELAKAFGVDKVYDLINSDVGRDIKKESEGGGLDIAIEVSDNYNDPMKR